MARYLLLVALLPLVVSCTLTPDYERPELEVPEQYLEPVPGGESVANLDWWELFHDEQLQLLIRTALDENKDLGIALSRIQEARLTVTAVRANQFPFLNLGGFFGREKQSRELFPVPIPMTASGWRVISLTRSICGDNTVELPRRPALTCSPPSRRIARSLSVW